MVVEILMLQLSPDDIRDEDPLFGPGGIGLDSVDALQIVVSLEKKFGLKIPNQEVAKEVLHSISTIAHAVERESG